MTAFDRLEPQIPELMNELAPARMPDYFDDMLRQTARSRQRSAWSSPERWLPAGVTARTDTVGQMPWRAIAIAALLIVAAMAALVLIAGSGRRLPPPFGPARNGVIVTSIDGDIVTVDPVTGTKTVIVAGPETDVRPGFSSLGTQILFRRTLGDSEFAVMVADADGSNVRQLFSEPRDQQIPWWDWSADGRWLLYPRYELSGERMLMIDTVTGTTSEPHPGVDQHAAMWRPGHDEYLFYGSDSGRLGLYLASADGPAIRAIGFPDGSPFGTQLSPDGSKLAYVQGAGDGSGGPLHTIDVDTGLDRLLTRPGDGYKWLNPQFSPDGTHILAERYSERPSGAPDQPVRTYALVLVPVDGAGPVVELRPPPFEYGEPGNAQMQFSPDGKSVIANFGDVDASWILDTTGGPARRVDMSDSGGSPAPPAAPPAVPNVFGPGTSWQRLAP